MAGEGGTSPVWSIMIDREDIHTRFGGGLPRGSLIVISGNQGAGKSVMTQRWIYGLLENRVSVSWISTEMSFTELMRQMDSLDYGIGPSLMAKRLDVFPVYTSLGKRRLDQPQLELLRSPMLFRRDVVFIDTLSHMLALDKEQGWLNMERVASLVAHFKRMTASGRTIVITLETGEAPPEFEGPLKSAAGCLVEMDLRPEDGELIREMFIRRWARAETKAMDSLSFRVEPSIGVIPQITTAA